MGRIVCATGNGDRSRIVQNRAMEVARQQGKPLVFIHVIDVSRLGELDEALAAAAREELAWLGEAVLRLAQERAQRRGVRADFAIRYGRVLTALEEFLSEEPTDLLLLGEPTDRSIAEFAQTIQEKTGVPIELVKLPAAGDHRDSTITPAED